MCRDKNGEAFMLDTKDTKNMEEVKGTLVQYVSIFQKLHNTPLSVTYQVIFRYVSSVLDDR